MKLKSKYDKAEDIPAGYEDLYEEKDGAAVFNGLEGGGASKTDADVARLSKALEREREDHKTSKTKLRAWGDLNPEEVLPKLDEYDELKVAGAGKIDEAKMNELVEARIKTRIAPIERERDKLKTDLTERDKSLTQLQAEKADRILEEHLRRAIAPKVSEPALEDALLRAKNVFVVTEDGKPVTKEGVGVTPGLDPAAWIEDILPTKPHWGREFVGGGASSGGGGTRLSDEQNPWSKVGWNVTKQAQYEEKYGEERAAALARSVGSSLEAVRPPEK